MAMVILASFFCYNVGTVSERRVHYERSNRYYDTYGSYIPEYENDGPVIKIGTMYE